MNNSPIFKGINQITLDGKGRIAIPAMYRQDLLSCCNGNLVITIDKDESLLLYPQPEWIKIEATLVGLPALNKQARLLQRLTLGHAMECEMNSQGRVLLPPPLRMFAHIDKQVILIGQGNKFELWDLARWSKQRDIWIKEEGITKEVSEALADIQL